MAPPFFLSRPGKGFPFHPVGGRHAIFHKGSTLLRAPSVPPPALRCLPLVRPLQFLNASETEAALRRQTAHQTRAFLLQ
jgi:hypothetical protein